MYGNSNNKIFDLPHYGDKAITVMEMKEKKLYEVCKQEQAHIETAGFKIMASVEHKKQACLAQT